MSNLHTIMCWLVGTVASNGHAVDPIHVYISITWSPHDVTYDIMCIVVVILY